MSVAGGTPASFAGAESPGTTVTINANTAYLVGETGPSGYARSDTATCTSATGLAPGGSAVQSALLFRRIRELADEKGIPVIAFAEDVAASGGYWLALAGDEIFSEETSLLGSIGVISASFGFSQLIGRLGVERRLHTAGERKSLLDPFLPENPSDVARLTALQQDIHRTFKEHVCRRRAGKRIG